MSDDLIEKVESLLAYKLPKETFTLEVHDEEVFNQLKNVAGILELVPDLVAEIKRLREEAKMDELQIHNMDLQIKDKDDEIHKWHEIAKDRTAQIGWIASCKCGRLPDTLKWDYCDWSQDIPQSVRDGWNAWAAKELGIQPESYLHRLEADYLTWVREYYRDLGEEIAIQRAQAALEKIRHAKEIHC